MEMTSDQSLVFDGCLVWGLSKPNSQPSNTQKIKEETDAKVTYQLQRKIKD